MSADRIFALVMMMMILICDAFGLKVIHDYPQYRTDNLLFGGVLLCSTLTCITGGIYIWKRNKPWT